MPYETLKRTIDVGASLLGLAVLAPIFAGIAVAVRLDSPGPVLFRHERMGRFGRKFQLLKFRSMIHGARGAELTVAGDARVTAVGRLLRRTKLDELPQLWNVLAGDMSLVGPRPEVERYVRLFPAEYEVILSVRPGITDFATIEFRDEERVLAAAADPEAEYRNVVLPAKIALYRRYLAERSLSTDAKLLLRTVLAVLRWHGAGDPGPACGGKRPGP
jgi:lipopolysaccharide/colanic/teichoic acid biosynthesis glycosyltransferase